MDEEMDMADHLVAAAKKASRDGLTKEQFQNAASVFWDSWQEMLKMKNARLTND